MVFLHMFLFRKKKLFLVRLKFFNLSQFPLYLHRNMQSVTITVHGNNNNFLKTHSLHDHIMMTITYFWFTSKTYIKKYHIKCNMSM